MVPIVVVLALAYAADVLERLRDERLRSERFAVESERQRIAWELHDSAKQRVHAAHLVLSALQGQVSGSQAELVGHALFELRSAGADMDTSVAELRTPLEGRPVERLLEERAAELAPGTEALITVRGTSASCRAHIAAHAYRIGAEALTNAVRHGEAPSMSTSCSRATARARRSRSATTAAGCRRSAARAPTACARCAPAPTRSAPRSSIGPGDGRARHERRAVLPDRSARRREPKP